jgi:anti-sigma factor (TIGR02949 family)
MTDATTTTSPPSPEECAHAVRQLWDYLDGRLPDAERERVAAHLAVCDACTSHFAFERGFLDAVRTLRRDDPAFAALRGRVLGALRAARTEG